MNCSEFSNSISAYLDAELNEDKMHQFQTHFSVCPTCCHEYNQYVLMQKAIKDMPDKEVPPELSERIKAAVENQRRISLIDKFCVKNRGWRKYMFSAAMLLLLIGVTGLIGNKLIIDDADSRPELNFTADFRSNDNLTEALPQTPSVFSLNAIGYTGNEEKQCNTPQVAPNTCEIKSDANVTLIVRDIDKAVDELRQIATDFAAFCCYENETMMFCMHIKLGQYDDVYAKIGKMEQLQSIMSFVEKEEFQKQELSILRINLQKTESAR